MTKTKSTKHALLMSLLALIVCLSMFVGSTFAWFTDSVTSTGNIIKSGTLEVTMTWADGKTDPANTTWTDASKGAIFNSDLWEPGYVEVRHIKIANEGTLALKYQLNILANGAVSELADVIDVYYVDPAVKVENRDALATVGKIGTLSEVLAKVSTTAAGELKAGENHTITLALKMQETAGNEYQDKSIGSDFSVQLMATQLTAENDSFDNTYDEAAEFLNKDENGNWLVSNAGELLYLAQQVNSGNSYQGETILLTKDIDLNNMAWTPIGNANNGFKGTFDGQENTISNYSVTGKTSIGLFGYALNGGNIKNLKVKNATVKANDYAGAILGRGYTDVVNCHVEDSTVTVTPYLLDNGNYDGGAKAGAVVGQLLEGAGNTLVNCTAKNVKVKGYRDIGAVLGMAHNDNTVTDCKAYDSEVSYLYLEEGQTYDGNKVNENIGEVIGRRNSGVIETGTYFENVVLNIRAFANSEAELETAIKDGATTVVLGSGEYAIPDSAKGKTLTVIGNGDTVVAVQDDGASEGDIDYSFDGATVTFENVTLNIKGSDHPGYARMSAVYNNCTITGSNYTLYGDSVFNNCTFNLNNGYVWTWGAANVEFNNCTFEDKVGGKAKAILVHNTVETVVTVKDCTFIATTPAQTWDSIPVAAVSIDPENGSPDATVHFEGTNTYSDAFYALYQVKYAEEVDDVTITVDGTEVTVTAMK